MAEDRSPAFQYYPKDLLSDARVLAMSLEEFGAYWKLVSICWIEDGLPTDPTMLAKLLQVTPKRFQKLWPAIQPCFRSMEGNDEKLNHPRLVEERRKQARYSAAMAENGAKGGRPQKAAACSEKPAAFFEKSRLKAEKSSASASSSSSADLEEGGGAVSLSPVLLEYPTHGAAKTWSLTEADLAQWQALYPHLDLLAEARQALAWVIANPERRKTAKGMPRFLVNWFARSNDRGASREHPEKSRLTTRLEDTTRAFVRGATA